MVHACRFRCCCVASYTSCLPIADFAVFVLVVVEVSLAATSPAAAN